MDSNPSITIRPITASVAENPHVWEFALLRPTNTRAADKMVSKVPCATRYKRHIWRLWNNVYSLSGKSRIYLTCASSKYISEESMFMILHHTIIRLLRIYPYRYEFTLIMVW
jgi:hypothetical protein